MVIVVLMKAKSTSLFVTDIAVGEEEGEGMEEGVGSTFPCLLIIRLIPSIRTTSHRIHM